jgi:hypothetical protein
MSRITYIQLEEEIFIHKRKREMEKCQACQGTGCVGTVPCDCKVGRLRTEIIRYLTPLYRRAEISDAISKIPSEEFLRNLFIEGVPQEKFKSFVKTALLSSNMRYSHLTHSAYEIMEIYLGKVDGLHLMDLYKKPDLLILNLSCDPANAHYGPVLQTLLEGRTQREKWTWVNSRHPIDSGTCKKNYGSDFW